MSVDDIQKLYDSLIRVECRQIDNHQEVIQRLTTLEAVRHTPDDCPNSTRLDDHIEDHDVCARDSRWRDFLRDLMKMGAAAAAALIASRNV